MVQTLLLWILIGLLLGWMLIFAILACATPGTRKPSSEPEPEPVRISWNGPDKRGLQEGGRHAGIAQR
jgi:hypothetical protein